MSRINRCLRLPFLTPVVVATMAGLAVSAQPQTRPASSGSDVAAKAGPFTVAQLLAEWTDPDRQRSIPVRIYYPQDAATRHPVIIFSHGLGGSRDGYAYLGRHWATHGYITIHPQHLGTDENVGQGKERQEAAQAFLKAASAENAAARVRDVEFAVSCLPGLDQSAGPLQGRLDLNRIGVAGHSFGGHTTLQAAGASSDRYAADADSRNRKIKAAIAISPPPPRIFNDVYDAVRIPCLHITGTKDDAPLLAIEPRDRRTPYDRIRHQHQYLIVFEGADHRVFSIRAPRPGREQHDERIRDLTRACTVVFWNAYLRDDARARRWLLEEMKPGLQTDATVEMKVVAAPLGEASSEPANGGQVELRRAMILPDETQAVTIHLREERDSVSEAAGRQQHLLDIELAGRLRRDSGGENDGRRAILSITELKVTYGRTDEEQGLLRYDSERKGEAEDRALAEMLDHLPGTELELQFDVRGRLVRASGLDPIWRRADLLLAPPGLLAVQWAFRDAPMTELLSEALFPPLPAGPVGVGDVWKEEVPANVPLVTRLTARSTSRLARIEQSSRQPPLVHIESDATIEPAPPILPGRPPSIRPAVQAGRQTSTLTLDPASHGLIHQTQRTLDLRLTMVPPAGEARQEMTIHQKRTLSARRGMKDVEGGAR